LGDLLLVGAIKMILCNRCSYWCSLYIWSCCCRGKHILTDFAVCSPHVLRIVPNRIHIVPNKIAVFEILLLGTINSA